MENILAEMFLLDNFIRKSYFGFDAKFIMAVTNFQYSFTTLLVMF
jgi:hypothetical protein